MGLGLRLGRGPGIVVTRCWVQEQEDSGYPSAYPSADEYMGWLLSKGELKRFVRGEFRVFIRFVSEFLNFA